MARRTLADHHLGHVVCTTCHTLRSLDQDPDEIFRDTCACTRDEPDPTHREARVPCRICAGCGLAIAPGHTRWRQNFCAPCRSDFVELRAMLGWSHIPLGLHSLVNQTGTLTADQLAAVRASPDGRRLLERRAAQLATELTGMSRGIEHLYTHVDQLTGRRLDTLGLTGEPTVPWDDYLAACHTASITDDDGWAALLDAFDLADWADDVRAFRRSRNDDRFG